MRSTNIFFILISLFINQAVDAQTGCTDPAATNYNATATINDGSCIYSSLTINPLLVGKLNSAISSSSGLVWTDGNLWTHNDSGNPADIYRIDTTNGKTLQTVVIDNYPNTDWEDITADSLYIYVSDCGNNNGDRRDLKILKIAKADITIGTATVHVNAEAISLSYTDQTSYTASSTNNFDCESIVSIKDSLYLFSKDRGDLSTRVYKLPKIPGTYAVSPITSYHVDGLITGADYNAATQEIMLIGYMSGHVNSFMWFLDDFKGDQFFSGDKRRVEIGNGQEWQTEGVTYITPNRFFISNETAGNIDASLFTSAKTWPTPPKDTTVANTGMGSIHEVGVTYYPNPCTGVLHIKGVNTRGAYTIIDQKGYSVQTGIMSTGNNNINIGPLPIATYFMELKGEDGSKSIVKVVKE
ncbi:MAG: T9SS type A sorting domain-containing protein [Flavipsychrobacter sp.]|nr:T9SS type A sorting domain-containing protein [Flavipsychrobacter sp.]